jgi:hypothetical protein
VTSPAAGRALLGTYFGRSSQLTVTAHGDTLGVVNRDRFSPLRLTSDNEGYLGPDSAPTPIRFPRRADGRVDRLILVTSGDELDYNDGPNDPRGPDRPEWSRYEGDYQYLVWGQDTTNNTVHRKNGYLYFWDYRLDEYEPGLFFSSTGEALDLRGSAPTWRNIKLWKKE